ncbi:MAG: S26 family signal peptidase [Lachnospiraceae bacterium]|nr:S26 family signal peptidase [Lachnospiraceae bacterium]
MEALQETSPLSLEEVLRRYGTLTYKNVGTSMLPLIKQGRDVFTLKARDGRRCEKYDVVLFRRGGRWIMHRVIKVRPDDYVIRGDNCYTEETGVHDEDIAAVMTEFVRKGKTHRVTEWPYRLYARVWTALFPLRKAARDLWHLMKKRTEP